MRDIVAELDRLAIPNQTTEDAAREIERLRAALGSCVKELEHYGDDGAGCFDASTIKAIEVAKSLLPAYQQYGGQK